MGKYFEYEYKINTQQIEKDLEKEIIRIANNNGFNGIKITYITAPDNTTVVFKSSFEMIRTPSYDIENLVEKQIRNAITSILNSDDVIEVNEIYEYKIKKLKTKNEYIITAEIDLNWV